MSTLAVFIALGGSSYAVTHIGSRDIANNSIRGKDVRNRSLTERDLKRNTLTGRSIRESRLGARAARAQRRPRRRPDRRGAEDQVPGRNASRSRTSASNQRHARPRRTASAVLECADTGRPAGPGRRLPTHGELRAALAAVPLAAGGELTSEVVPVERLGRATLDVLYVTDAVGSVALTPNTGAGAKAFRCVADPLN